MKYLIVYFCIFLALVNVPFIVEDPSRWWNWASAVFCSYMAIFNWAMVKDL